MSIFKISTYLLGVYERAVKLVQLFRPPWAVVEDTLSRKLRHHDRPPGGVTGFNTIGGTGQSAARSANKIVAGDAANMPVFYSIPEAETDAASTVKDQIKGTVFSTFGFTWRLGSE